MNNKGADQTVRMRKLTAPLLFAYGINRFSHDMALLHWSTIETSHEIMALFVLHKLILQTRMHSHPNGARCLIFGRTLRLLPYFMCKNSGGSGETERMRRLARAFAGRLCDKYHNLMSWLNYLLYTLFMS